MSWISPFSLPGRWYKGNLHTHTTLSDGGAAPEEAIAWYREHGYDFLALTDHWVLARGQSGAPADGFITIGGAELHGSGYHLLALGLSALPDVRLAESAQGVVSAVLASGGLPFIAHPYWTGQTSAEIAPLQGLQGIEVFNSVCEQMDGRGYSSVHWDELLARGLRLSGLAVDDVHWRHGEVGQGFVMVRAQRLDEASILDALRQGHFYASNGPQITDLRLVQLPDGRQGLQCTCSPCRSITFYAAQPMLQRHVAPPGESLDTATCPLWAEQVYLRVECRDQDGRTAWSNPLFTADVL